jgi:hypothetical protein
MALGIAQILAKRRDTKQTPNFILHIHKKFFILLMYENFVNEESKYVLLCCVFEGRKA